MKVGQNYVQITYIDSATLKYHQLTNFISIFFNNPNIQEYAPVTWKRTIPMIIKIKYEWNLHNNNNNAFRGILCNL